MIKPTQERVIPDSMLNLLPLFFHYWASVFDDATIDVSP
jgi:hypothetical protein